MHVIILACFFTKSNFYVDTISYPFGVFPANPQITNYENPIITDTLNWIKVSGVFKATGGEQYLTLGNFKYDNETNYRIVQNSTVTKAGYYIDDVSVIPLDSFNLKADAGKDSLINAGDSVFIGSYTNGIDTLKWVNQNTNFAIDSTRPGFWVKPTSNTCYILTQTVNNFTSSDTVCIRVRPLPLTFLEFSIFPSLGGVRGGWKTSNEVNVSHFNLQFSENGKDFYTIRKIAAKKQSLNTYEFTYQSHLLGVEGLFRIEAVDKDGKKNYSQTKSLNIKHSSSNITVYPNPAKDFVRINHLPSSEIKIVNTLGKIIIAKTTKSNATTQLNVANLPNGLYVVIVQHNGVVFTQKLMISN